MSEVAGDTEPKKFEEAVVKPAESPDRAMEEQNPDKAKANRLKVLAGSFSEKADDLEDSLHIPLNPEMEDDLLAEKRSEKQAAWQALSEFLKLNGQANEADVNIGGDRTEHRVYDKLPASPKNASVKSNASGFKVEWTSSDFPSNEGYTQVTIDPKTYRITYASTEITRD